MHAAFDNTEGWSPMYQRNNKRTGLKNIRCFPYCSDQHIEKGFCGRPIILRVARSYRDQTPPVYAWGEFRRIDEPRDVDVGTILTGDDIRSRTKDPKSAKAETLNAPYFEGIVEGGEKSRMNPLVKFVFNQRKKGWNYAWQASKHTAKARHAFFAYLFIQEKEDEEIFKCVGVYVSPTFILYCRKPKSEQGMGRSGVRGKGDNDDDIFDDDLDEEDGDSAAVATAAAAASSTKSKRKASPRARKRQALDIVGPNQNKKAEPFSLDPIVPPQSKFANGPLSASSAFTAFGGEGMTPITSMFMSFGTPSGGVTSAAISGELSPLFAQRRSSANTGTPSTWSGDDSEDYGIDFDTAQQIDQTVMARIAAVLDRIHDILTADGSAETLGMPQFALDWFINDLEEIADDAFGGNSNGALPVLGSNSRNPVLPDVLGEPPIGQDLELLDWAAGGSSLLANEKDMLTELVEYLMEETALSAAIRQIIARAQEQGLSSEARSKAFIRLFQNELSNFLAKRGYSERDLDEALALYQLVARGDQTKTDSAQKTLESLDKHVNHLVETQQRLDSARINPWVRAVTVRPEIDVSGQWRLDDTLLRAFDECRQRRNIPYMMRKLLGYMETRVTITHHPERVLIALKHKLFASPVVVYELDGVERVWDVTPPVPWPSKLCETYCAWIEDDSLRYYHTYNGVSRTERIIKKNASGDRLEMAVYYQEKDAQGIWQTVLFRRGYLLRITQV